MDDVHVLRTPVERIRALGPAGIALGTALMTALLLGSLRVLSPGFDPAYRLMSEYALGFYGWVLALTFLCWGVSSWALAMPFTGRFGRALRGLASSFSWLPGAGRPWPPPSTSGTIAVTTWPARSG